MRQWPMSNNEKWFLILSNFLSVVTGLVYLWMIYFLTPLNEWDVFNHPWQKHVQALHILVVPLLLFALGLIWKKHIYERLFRRDQSRKFSGWILILIFFPMVFSGYFLQVSTEEIWRNIHGQVHLWTSLAWSLMFIVHIFKFFKI